jgi:hypothetical protein
MRVIPVMFVPAGMTRSVDLMLSHANVHAINLHLQEISTQVSQGAFAVLTQPRSPAFGPFKSIRGATTHPPVALPLTRQWSGQQ